MLTGIKGALCCLLQKLGLVRGRGVILSHARISAKTAFFALNNLRLLENHYKKTKQRRCHG